MTLVPAYGRDYKSKAAVLADLNDTVNVKDFQCADLMSGSGYINRNQMEEMGTVTIRYNKLRSCMIAKNVNGTWK
jgi:hypothetical protein